MGMGGGVQSHFSMRTIWAPGRACLPGQALRCISRAVHGTGAREDAASIPGACGGAEVVGMLVSQSCGHRRNALVWLVACGMACATVPARAGAESHLGPPRAIPCAYSPVAGMGWETNNPITMAKNKNEVPDVKQWMKLFGSTALYKHEPSRLLEDYLDLVLCCVANQRQEEHYLKVAKRYTRDELEVIAQLFGMHVVIHEHQVKHGVLPWYDMLGDVYQELASRSKTSRMGQFFTPVELSEVIARISFDDGPEQAVGKTVLDPAAGSGRLLLAAHGLQPRVGTLFAADLDPICAKMCALNFWLHGIRGEVAWMDSLRQEWYYAWQTHPRATWPFVTWLGEDRKEESLLYTSRDQVATVKQALAPDLFSTVQEPEEQYGRLKAQYPDAVLMFRLPGSYLFLHDDVETVGRVMDLTVGTSNVLRIPASWYDDVLPALCKAGYRVAVCDESLAA
jgi:type I restriction enzyme M protein